MNQNKMDNAINIIRRLNKENDPYVLAFSGGKDSVVLYDIALKSGIYFEAEYGNTTIDPPGTMSFIREHYPDVKILHPKKSFYELIKHRGLPTRVGRYCCQELKEKAGIGRRTLDGVRWAESSKRSKYTIEDCDTRKWMKGAKHIRPILDWTDKDVWDYIKENNLPYSKYYDPPYNFKRHGCMGCPLASTKNQIHELKLFKNHTRLIIKSIKAHMEFKPDNKMARVFKDEYEAFYWWVTQQPLDRYIDLREQELFKSNYKKLIIKAFNL